VDVAMRSDSVPNHPALGNAALAPVLAVGSHRRGVPEPGGIA